MRKKDWQRNTKELKSVKKRRGMREKEKKKETQTKEKKLKK